MFHDESFKPIDLGAEADPEGVARGRMEAPEAEAP